MQFDSLPGFRDFYPESCSLETIFLTTGATLLSSFNFLEYDAPVLESLDLYRKVGRRNCQPTL